MEVILPSESSAGRLDPENTTLVRGLYVVAFTRGLPLKSRVPERALFSMRRTPHRSVPLLVMMLGIART
jgi:hypothetical protein